MLVTDGCSRAALIRRMQPTRLLLAEAFTLVALGVDGISTDNPDIGVASRR